MDSDIKREFDKLHKRLKELTEEKKSTWVPPSWIMEITGWSKRKLQTAREQGIVETKESPGGGYLYLLESIPEIFLKVKQAS